VNIDDKQPLIKGSHNMHGSITLPTYYIYSNIRDSLAHKIASQPSTFKKIPTWNMLNLCN